LNAAVCLRANLAALLSERAAPECTFMYQLKAAN
jgi:hypothetical protein